MTPATVTVSAPLGQHSARPPVQAFIPSQLPTAFASTSQPPPPPVNFQFPQAQMGPPVSHSTQVSTGFTPPIANHSSTSNFAQVSNAMRPPVPAYFTPQVNAASPFSSAPHPPTGNSHVPAYFPHVSASPVQWHSGMSPHPYELVTLPSRAKVCYGCGHQFTAEHRLPPNNLVFKHVDRRVIKRDERTSLLIYSIDFSNTYYHLDIEHIKRKNPTFNRTAYISFDLYNSLDQGSKFLLDSIGLNVIMR